MGNQPHEIALRTHMYYLIRKKNQTLEGMEVNTCPYLYLRVGGAGTYRLTYRAGAKPHV